MEQDCREALKETLGSAEEVSAVRGVIAGHRWIFARTYAAFCPHEYTLRREWAEDAEFRLLVKHIRKYGAEAFYGKKKYANRYWFDHENGYYYFITPEDTDGEGNVAESCVLVNRAKIADFDFWKDEEKGIIRCAWNGKKNPEGP